MTTPTPHAELIVDSCAIALIGAGWLEHTVEVHGINTSSPRVTLRVRVPWWRWLLFDAAELEVRVWRCLVSIAAPPGRWLEYRVRVERCLVGRAFSSRCVGRNRRK